MAGGCCTSVTHHQSSFVTRSVRVFQTKPNSSFVTRSVRVFQTKPNAELLWSRTMNPTPNAPPQRTYEHSNTAVEKRIPTTVQKVSAE
ncbi:unnamed protein product [Heterosigma akashiwo]